jgi:hypothetical protein
MRTATPHRAHVNTRASAAASARASRGLYKSGRARDPLSGYPVLSRHRGRFNQEARDVTPGLHPQTPGSACHTNGPRGNRLRFTSGGSVGHFSRAPPWRFWRASKTGAPTFRSGWPPLPLTAAGRHNEYAMGGHFAGRRPRYGNRIQNRAPRLKRERWRSARTALAMPSPQARKQREAGWATGAVLARPFGRSDAVSDRHGLASCHPDRNTGRE